MPETRYRIHLDVDGNEIERIPYEVSDKELAEEAEKRAFAKANELIDAIANLSDAKLFLKRLCTRLIKNGYLP